MTNLDLSKTRIESIGKHLPETLEETKHRNTVKETTSGMKTLLGQISSGTTEKIRAERQARKKQTKEVCFIIAVIIAIGTAVLFLL